MVYYGYLLRELGSLKGRTLISFHSRGDVEAVASAFALQKLVPRSTVAAPDKVKAQAKVLVDKLKLKLGVLRKGELNKFDNLVLVDVANSDMLGDWGEEVENYSKKRTVVAIDHHDHSGFLKRAAVYEYPNRTSCCEIVYDLYKISKQHIDRSTATMLLAGIITDTATFRTADINTFRTATQLLTLSGKSYNEVASLFHSETSGEAIKQLIKQLGKASFEEVETKHGKVAVGIALAGFYESKIVSNLVELGCGVALCLNEQEGRVYAVKDNTCPAAIKLHIGKLMKSVGSNMKGTGGGHEAVGGAHGDATLAPLAFRKAIEEVKEKLRK